MFRVLMRREQVLKIATNHLISLDMSLKPSCTSESAWCWVANDTAEGQAKVETLSVKFKVGCEMCCPLLGHWSGLVVSLRFFR